MKYSQEQPHTKKCVQKQLQKFPRLLHKLCTLCVKIFITFQWLWKSIGWLLSRKRYMSPGQCCYSIGLYKPLIIVSVQGYLILIDQVHLVLLILKQHFLTVYCFTIKQASLLIIKRKSFSDNTFFCIFAALLLYFFYLSIRIHLCP